MDYLYTQHRALIEIEASKYLDRRKLANKVSVCSLMSKIILSSAPHFLLPDVEIDLEALLLSPLPLILYARRR